MMQKKKDLTTFLNYHNDLLDHNDWSDVNRFQLMTLEGKLNLEFLYCDSMAKTNEVENVDENHSYDDENEKIDDDDHVSLSPFHHIHKIDVQPPD